jgi:phosphoglycolate phosphatase
MLRKKSVFNILFDLDGTLTDPVRGITGSIQYALKKLGKPVPAADELLWCIGPPLLGSFIKMLGTDSGIAETALSLYRDRYSAEGKFKNEIYAGIPETLQGLIEQGFNLFVATSKPQVFANEILVHFNLLHFFRGVYGSEFDGTLVDKGELIAYILKKETISAKNTIMVGDRSYDILGAKKHGIYSVGVTYGYGTKEELIGSGADYIIDFPEEIMGVVKNSGRDRTR